MASQDERNDELVTRSAAMVIHWFRENLKKEIRAALKEIYHEFWAELFSYVYRSNWVRLLVGLMTLASAIALWLHEEFK